MANRFEIDTVVKGIDLSWTTWAKMQDEDLTDGDIRYLKSKNGKGFERIFSVNIKENQEFRIQQMISYIKAGIMPDSMLITPKTEPQNLAGILAHKGFDIDDKDPCMLMYLGDYTGKPTMIDNFDVTYVTEKKLLAQWLDIINRALFGCELVSLEQFNDILKLDNTHFYLGFYNSTPVTACMTISEDDTSVLEMVATLSEYRRRGFASQAINKALHDLKEKGIKTISLRAEADGVGVYKKLGFKTIFNRVLASCNWDKVYKAACPCQIGNEKVIKAQQIKDTCNDIEEFTAQMKKQNIIGRDIWYNANENAIYITKMYACDCGGGCKTNDTTIGRRCHCEYVNHLSENIPVSYCKCSAYFYEAMFIPLFGENIQIEPVETVLSGAEECIFKISI